MFQMQVHSIASPPWLTERNDTENLLGSGNKQEMLLLPILGNFKVSERQVFYMPPFKPKMVDLCQVNDSCKAQNKQYGWLLLCHERNGFHQAWSFCENYVFDLNGRAAGPKTSPEEE